MVPSAHVVVFYTVEAAGAFSQLLPSDWQASPIEQGFASRITPALTAMLAGALFTMLAIVRHPTTCAFVLPL
jgi:hypothetical protein